MGSGVTDPFTSTTPSPMTPVTHGSQSQPSLYRDPLSVKSPDGRVIDDLSLGSPLAVGPST